MKSEKGKLNPNGLTSFLTTEQKNFWLVGGLTNLE